jgi:DNA-binding response OmpR family regulator
MGFRLALDRPFDCIILHLLLPGKEGLLILKDLRKAGQKDRILRPIAVFGLHEELFRKKHRTAMCVGQ